jgi:hypothetical protein
LQEEIDGFLAARTPRRNPDREAYGHASGGSSQAVRRIQPKLLGPFRSGEMIGAVEPDGKFVIVNSTNGIARSAYSIEKCGYLKEYLADTLPPETGVKLGISVDTDDHDGACQTFPIQPGEMTQ